ncbi:2-oxoglutarate (2OG) and Fe(II)-dependent oxygenase superfamily protein [Actinidia rufa]|uniref:2-oxoglutarate (2OG) and Fe(II)-dependent oxygenase superfamily protein n=1 Tax=Actinidia rufa TaxID=165716 RepID=A0A7J0GS34_9ERIC|nr:2-oxoglutarate (2OG) and Fe(II)-dependent oxygenase superfamily protein [Actinidia rufa]
MEEGVGILEPYEVRFSDLMLLSSNKVSSPSFPSEEIERLESIARSVMENLGPSGPGLLTISGVPNASRLRRTLLPLARRLALLDDVDDRKRVLKEHKLGSDVPLKNLDRSVSSFAMQLKYMQGVKRMSSKVGHEGNDNRNKDRQCPFLEELRDLQDGEFKNLGNSFKELGFCMMEVGLCLARICDRAVGGQELEQSLLESCTAKGRLIHYHSTLDNFILKGTAERQQSTRRKSNRQSIKNEAPHTTGNEAGSCVNHSNLWQQWHYDYGIFTVLTAPWFILPCHKQATRANGCFCMSCDQEHPSPSSHSYLKIYDPNKNNVQNAELEDLSRETFVVFLQPAWSKTFSLSNYPIESSQSNGQCSAECTDKTCIREHEHGKLGQELHEIVPPLSSRLKDGMTFAEFSRETTKQYYGGSGLQSKRF